MSETMIADNVISPAEIIKRAVRLGAEIRNIRLSGDLADEVFCAVDRLLIEHKVIFFRDQRHFDDAKQQRFAVRLSELVPHGRVRAIQETSSTLRLDLGYDGTRAHRRHADLAVEAYLKSSVLRGVMIPSCGGDSLWPNMVAAYLDLPLPLRMLADDLWAVHSNAHYYTVNAHATEADKEHLDEVFIGAIDETKLPVVRVHPETGERTLVLGNFVQHFVGLQKYTGQKLFDLFQSYVMAPENIVRWSWKMGDVAIWDNRATQHYVLNDDSDHDLLTRRVAMVECAQGCRPQPEPRQYVEATGGQCLSSLGWHTDRRCWGQC
ncbi:TauD/TfdA dioxygenase family protein [Bradyrhizobium icense]|uniref:TauD/TfdA dioxygenase family protein n=1 Tax=Bradyrhizobium icense TaxID=1274631 RepID=UPI0009F6DC09|nr:TauD/TfdA family dioxygenase [Bradyrhizobium icense]